MSANMDSGEKGAGAERKIKVYDFKRPDKFSKDQIRTITMMHETFARLVTTSLSASLRTLVQAHCVAVDQMTYEEFIRSLPNPTVLAIVNMKPIRGSALLDIEPHLTVAMLERLFGGQGKPLDVSRDLTAIETDVIEETIATLLGNLRESWSTVIDLRPSVGQMETNPQFAQIVPPSEMVVTVTLDLRLGEEAEGSMNLCFPYLTLEPLTHKLSAMYWYSAVRKSTDTEHVARVGDLKVDAQVYFETEKLSLHDLGQIAKGSLIKLPGCRGGQAFLRAGEETVLKLIQTNRRRQREFVFTIEADRPQNGTDWTAAEPEQSVEKTSEAKQIAELIKRPLEELGTELRTSSERLDRRMAELTSRQDELCDQLLFGSQERELPEQPSQSVGHLRRFGFITPENRDHVAVYLSMEHPQTAAMILSYLEPNLTADVLSRLDEELQVEVAERIATLDQIHPEVVKRVERVLENKVGIMASPEHARVGGVNAAAEILNLSSFSVERQVMRKLQEKNPELADDIKAQMFVFEDIGLLDDSAVGSVLRAAKREDVLTALKGADPLVHERLVANTDTSEQAQFQQDFQDLGPVRLGDVEAAQQRIIAVVKELEESGAIVVARKGALVE